VNKHVGSEALETVKVFNVTPLFSKEGLGGDFFKKISLTISMAYIFIKSPFLKGGG
jgi:hypothetical protein